MKKQIIIGVLILLLVMVGIGGYMYKGMVNQMNNTDPTYWEADIKDIEARYPDLEEQDIVFIGSSSIRKWVTLDEDFSGYKVVNHGFGGSKVADSTYYYDRLVTAFRPKAVVLFAGTNNIHGMTDASDSAEKVLEDFKKFYEKSTEALPDVPVYYISISPTKARWKVWNEADEANQMIKAYADQLEGLTVIDTTEAMLLNGQPNEEILVGDGLHLNEDGYKLWTSLIHPVVTKSIK